MDIRRKRARAYLHSPDLDYAAKVAYLQDRWQHVLVEPEHDVLLYLDELAFERQLSLTCAYIEKLRRWLRQDVLHLHRLSDDWVRLKQRVLDFMAQVALPSPPLTR